MYPISVPRVSPFPATDCHPCCFQGLVPLSEKVSFCCSENAAQQPVTEESSATRRAENVPSKVCAQGCWQLNCFPGFVCHWSCGKSHTVFPLFPSLKNILKNTKDIPYSISFKKYVNGHYLRYPMVSPGTILKSCDSEQRCSCIRNGRNASPGPQGCGATKQSLDATSAFCSVDPIKVHVVCKPNNIYYTNLYHPFWPEMGFMNHPKYSNMVYLLLGLPWLLLVFQIIRPEILSQ